MRDRDWDSQVTICIPFLYCPLSVHPLRLHYSNKSVALTHWAHCFTRTQFKQNNILEVLNEFCTCTTGTRTRVFHWFIRRLGHSRSAICVLLWECVRHDWQHQLIRNDSRRHCCCLPTRTSHRGLLRLLNLSGELRPWLNIVHKNTFCTLFLRGKQKTTEVFNQMAEIFYNSKSLNAYW